MPIKTVLVEDNPRIRASLVPAMEELCGIEVIAIAETEAQAAEFMGRHADQWQLIVVDIALKQGTGFGVLRNCKTRNSKQHAVVLTNYLTDDVRSRAMGLGAEAVFDKSTELEAFFQRCMTFDF